ncbi:MAG: hypothetical protein OXC60_09865 [Litoreibacter sp.]|nr:hypothetical protein [Litoreibacter sp.]
MTLTWSGWTAYEASESRSPYVAWHESTKPDQAGTKPPQWDPAPGKLSAAEAILAEFPAGNVPMRDSARNPDFWQQVMKAKDSDGRPDLGIWSPSLASQDIPKLPPDAVIVGVIDRGIPLHHARLRYGDETRIVAAWQMDAPWEANAPSNLPMGREVFQKEINETIAAHGADEDAIMQAFGLLDMRDKNGPRSVARRQSHGAAVMDLVSGYAPGAAPENIFVIAVNLPDRETIGLSGTFLDYFTTLALYRIAALADYLWAENSKRWQSEGLSPAEGQGGFPCVVNLSFGKNAGPRNGTGFFQTMVKELRESRPFGAPLSLVIPTGNDNLAQGHAVLDIGADGASDDLGWMVSPEDQSQNFVEIWTDPIEEDAVDKIGIDVALPGQSPTAPAYPTEPQAEPVASPSPKIGIVRTLNMTGEDRPFGALYRRQFPEPDAPGFVRVQFVLAVLPTLNLSEINRTVPSGEWRITLTNKSAKPITASLSVQTDQSPLPTAAQGLRSYFTDPSYSRFDQQGRVRDSYAFPLTDPPTDSDLAHKVSRHGSLNATASAPGTVIVAGHLANSGRPADYSATGPKNGADWQMPTLSCPTEAGTVHIGTITAGSREGYALPAPGTSFASAQATRAIAEELARLARAAQNASELDEFDAVAWAATDAARQDEASATAVPKAKLGSGRMAWPETSRQAGRTAEQVF